MACPGGVPGSGAPMPGRRHVSHLYFIKISGKGDGAMGRCQRDKGGVWAYWG